MKLGSDGSTWTAHGLTLASAKFAAGDRFFVNLENSTTPTPKKYCGTSGSTCDGTMTTLNSAFNAMNKQAKDVSVGSDGSIWIIANDYSVHKWDHLNATWLLRSQHLDSIWDKVPVISISVDPTGNPWVLDGFGRHHLFSHSDNINFLWILTCFVDFE